MVESVCHMVQGCLVALNANVHYGVDCTEVYIHDIASSHRIFSKVSVDRALTPKEFVKLIAEFYAFPELCVAYEREILTLLDCVTTKVENAMSKLHRKGYTGRSIDFRLPTVKRYERRDK